MKNQMMLLRSLHYRNYRLFFIGQGISLTGTWMQQVAMGWLVYRLTNSPFLLGIVGFAGQIPTFLLASIAGLAADRFDRRQILIFTQIASMLQALILTVLTLTETIAVWHIILLSTMLGLVNSLDIPSRHSFIVDMVENKEVLGNAIALNSFIFNGARLIGPSIAGIVIAAAGEGICFLLNALSYIAIIVSLFTMKIKPREINHSVSSGLRGLKEGFVYAYNFIPIRIILFLLSIVSLMGAPYAVLMPVFARDILKGGPHTLGFLMASTGVGALIGALYLASRRTVLGLGRLIAVASSIFGIGLIIFSLSHTLWLSLLLLAFIGFGMMVQMASCNTVLQTIVEDDKRGRVMSLYTMSFMGMMPFGSLIAGSISNKIGAPYTLVIGGIFCILGSIYFTSNLPLIRKIIRPIYIKMGIIPEISKGIEISTQLMQPPGAKR